MERDDFFQEVAINAFYANACEMVSEDIEDFQECLRLNTLNNRMKDEYETFKCYVNFKYAILARCEVELGCQDGIELAYLAESILLSLCEARNINDIKKVIPRWLDAEERWGWAIVYK